MHVYTHTEGCCLAQARRGQFACRQGLAWHIQTAVLRLTEGLQVTHQSHSRLSYRSTGYPRHCRSCRSPCTAAQRGQAGLRQCLKLGIRSEQHIAVTAEAPP